jgi:DHA1 family bicyclomycin/chloramphenicol resistance-like MFS transporter
MRRIVAILGALSAFGPLSVDFYLPGLPKLTTDFHASASAGQLTLTGCVLGLALGQLAIGPLSDRFGRRPPLVAGLVLYCVASLACAAAPSIWVFVALRVVQGLSGAAGIVVARSVVRDIASGAAAARLYSVLILVLGVVPIVAPVVGGQLLAVTSWRGLFVILALVDLAILVATALWLPETLPPKHDTRVTGFLDLLRDRYFLAYSLVVGLSFASMFGYIAGSSFVLQDVYGISPQLYGAVFGLNACGLVACSQLNRSLVGRAGTRRLLVVGVVAQAAAGSALVGIVVAGGVGLAGILPCLFVTVAALGFVMPNGTTLALAGYPHAAGSASALLGTMQFLFGAAAAPLVGIAGRQSAVPMALMIGAFGVGSLFVLAAARRAALAPSTIAVLGSRP